MHFKLIISLIIISAFAACNKKSEVQKPNILFICVDDLRPELGCYNAPQVISPNINKLANEGFQFNRAYCNVPVCGASRASLLTGVLPTKRRFVQYHAYAQQDAPNAKTLPQVFKEAGYTTVSFGKVFHHKDDREKESWSKEAWLSEEGDANYRTALDPTTMLQLSKKGRGRIYESPDVEDSAYPDGKIAQKTIQQLKEFKKTGEPFFLACGFIRPHLPFYAPKKYWDLYNRETIQLATNQYRPQNAPSELKGSGEFNNYHLANLEPNSEAFHRIMKHGYLASVSYVDQLIGNVLSELRNLSLDKNTVVVLWGDHGWHLGEHNFWSKHNTMHHAMQVPLIIKLPNKDQGAECNAFIESTDIFPSLCDLAGIETPMSVQGKSFTALFNQPQDEFRSHIYCRYTTADAIVTKDFSFTRYNTEQGSMMLYDHRNDPDENVNLANSPNYQSTVEKMQHLLESSIARAESYEYNFIK